MAKMRDIQNSQKRAKKNHKRTIYTNKNPYDIQAAEIGVSPNH